MKDKKYLLKNHLLIDGNLFGKRNEIIEVSKENKEWIVSNKYGIIIRFNEIQDYDKFYMHYVGHELCKYELQIIDFLKDYGEVKISEAAKEHSYLFESDDIHISYLVDDNTAMGGVEKGNMIVVNLNYYSLSNIFKEIKKDKAKQVRC